MPRNLVLLTLHFSQMLLLNSVQIIEGLSVHFFVVCRHVKLVLCVKPLYCMCRWDGRRWRWRENRRSRTTTGHQNKTRNFGLSWTERFRSIVNFT